MAEPVTFTDDNFDNEVVNSDLPVLVDFWAEWCGPCRMIGPIVKEMAIEYEGKAKIGKVNVDENPSISQKYGIRSIPSLLIFKNGEVVDQVVGAVPKTQLKKQLDAQLQN
jgi:thioredoxin 1